MLQTNNKNLPSGHYKFYISLVDFISHFRSSPNFMQYTQKLPASFMTPINSVIYSSK